MGQDNATPWLDDWGFNLRTWAYYVLGAYIIATDTGVFHGPATCTDGRCASCVAGATYHH